MQFRLGWDTVKRLLTNSPYHWFDDEYDNGNSGTTKTINWNNGNKQKVTLAPAAGNEVTLAFTAPPGTGNVTLKLVQDASGSRTVTWPATVKWPAGTAPTLTAAAGSIDIITLYYDETSYHGGSSLNFS